LESVIENDEIIDRQMLKVQKDKAGRQVKRHKHMLRVQAGQEEKVISG